MTRVRLKSKSFDSSPHLCVEIFQSVTLLSKTLLFRPYNQRVNSGKVVLLYNFPQNNIIKSPAIYSISTSKVSLFFFFYISSRVLITAVEIYMLGRRVAWSHTVGASIFHWAFCLLSFFISKPSPLEPSPLLTIKDVPSPPPPTPPILSHDPVPLLMWDSYVTSQAN